MVAYRAPVRNGYCRFAILAGHYLPAYDLGNDFARESGRYHVRYPVHNTLVNPAYILSGAFLGLRRLLYCFWWAGVTQLVCCPAKFIFGRSSQWRRLIHQAVPAYAKGARLMRGDASLKLLLVASTSRK